MLALVTAMEARAAVIVEYKFDGDCLDTSGNLQHGTPMGGAGYGTGRFGQAIMLDGINDFVHVPIANFTYTNFTMECWVNVPTYSTNIHYISLYQNAYLVLGNYGSGAISTWANGLSPIQIDGGSMGMSTGVWHHFAFTYDGVNQIIYVDGVPVTTTATTGMVNHDPVTHNDGLNIGARYTGSVQWVTGLIDNARLHDVALAPQDLGFFRDGASAAIRTVQTAATQVTAGQTGLAVSMEVENSGMNPIDITAADLTFTDSGAADVSSEYTVVPDAGNPTMIAAGATVTLDFSVDIQPAATTGVIVLDGTFSGVDQVSAAPVADSAADLTDSWTVLSCFATSCGDCNGDLTVTILDALTGAQHAAGLITLVGVAFTNCNVIGTLEPAPGAMVDILDALTLAQAAAGLPIALVCC